MSAQSCENTVLNMGFDACRRADFMQRYGYGDVAILETIRDRHGKHWGINDLRTAIHAWRALQAQDSGGRLAYR